MTVAEQRGRCMDKSLHDGATRSRNRRWLTVLGMAITFLFFAPCNGAPLNDSGLANTSPDAPASVQRDLSMLRLMGYGNWQTFTSKDGLPADKIFAVQIDGPRVWAGTSKGLALYENGSWRTFGTDDGLPYPVVLSLDICARTGDLWIGTMGGMARFSGGRIDAFTQLNSGLSNDFVNSVQCDPDRDDVWAATAMGANRYQLKSRRWTIYTHKNTPMHEPWTYSLAFGDDAVYIGVWGAGIVEYTKSTGRWREYRDPDKEFEIDLFPNDGPVHDVTAGVAFDDGILWQATYSGTARYDGREWASYFVKDSGLASDFVNAVHAQGRFGWFATDRGLSVTDGSIWVTYRRMDDGKGTIQVKRGNQLLQETSTPSAIAHNFVLGLDTNGDDIWIATAKGVTHGTRTGIQLVDPVTLAASVYDEARLDEELPDDRFSYANTPDPLQPYGALIPYRDFFTQRTPFYGTGRDEPDPTGLTSIRIGFIASIEDVEEPQRAPVVGPERIEGLKAMFGRRMFLGATLAVEEANINGGYKGIPFEIVPRTDFVLWGQSSNELVQFVHKDRVWSVLSGIDSNHNHVLARTALRTEIPLLNAGSTDPTLVEHTIPWLVRNINDDRQNAYVLLHEIYRVKKLRRIAILRVNDRDGRMGIKEFVQGARRLGHPIVIEQRYLPQDTDFEDQLERIRKTSPDALVLWSNPVKAGQIVHQIRQLGIEVPIFGFDRMADDLFLETAKESAEGVVIVATMNPDSEEVAWSTFVNRYQQRWVEKPDAFAAHAYDGMNLLINAIRTAGLNRVRIRDTLFELKQYLGVTGEIIFDTNMNDISKPWLAIVKDGRYHYYSAPGWQG